MRQSLLKVRDTVDITLKELATTDFTSKPELIRIKINSRANPLDIGVVAYAIRDYDPSIKTITDGIPVKKSSLVKERRQFLIRFIDLLILSDYREGSIIQLIANVKVVMAWIDQNNLTWLFSSIVDARRAYVAYSEYLFEHLHLEPKISINVAATNQKALENIINIYFDGRADQAFRNVPRLKSRKHEKDAPEHSTIVHMMQTFDWIASSYGDFFTNHLPFPYLLEMPSWSAYIFPSCKNCFISPYTFQENLIYNYKEGRVNTLSEMIEKTRSIQIENLFESKRKVSLTYAKEEAEARSRIKGAQDLIDRSNADKFHYKRLEMASLAMKCYLHLFQYLTASNPSQIADLLYDEEYIYENDVLKNEFKAIKFRAGKKIVTYHIESKRGLEIFKAYLKLRNEILKYKNFKYLFFTLNDKNKPVKLNPKLFMRVYESLKGKYIDESIQSVSSNDIRVNKTLILEYLGFDPQTTASVLQHTVETSQKIYSRTTESHQHREFSLFWESMRHASNSRSQSIPAGHCDDEENPESAVKNPPIKPDCINQFGCLYCKHYLCHADREDVHKLLSILYVAMEIRGSVSNFQFADSILGDLCARIRQAIEKLKSKSKRSREMVESIEKDVFQYHILTKFWELRLQRHEELISL